MNLLDIFQDLFGSGYNQAHLCHTNEKEECFCNQQETKPMESCKECAGLFLSIHAPIPWLLVPVKEMSAHVKFRYQLLECIPSFSHAGLCLCKEDSRFKVQLMTETWGFQTLSHP